MTRVRPLVVATLALLSAGSAGAQSPAPGGIPPPPGMSLAASAAMRFPQPIRVGDLLQRDVIEPVESQNRLGRLERIVRQSDGSLAAIITVGGFLGFGARPVAVQVDALVLLGDVVEVVALTPSEFRKLPTVSPGTATPVSADTVIKVGLAKPSH